MDRVLYAELLGRGREYDVAKAGQGNTSQVGLWSSAWARASSPPQGGFPATGSEVCTHETVGALQFDQPGVGESVKLLAASFRASLLGGCYVLDRLVHTAALPGSETGVQEVDTAALPDRVSDAVGVEIWLEVIGPFAANAAGAVTVTYTNSDGDPGRESAAFPLSVSMGTGVAVRVPLQTGDVGVLSVDGIEFASGWAAGSSMSVVLAKRVASLASSVANSTVSFGGLYLGPVDVPAGACLYFVTNGSSSSSPSFMVSLTMAAV